MIYYIYKEQGYKSLLSLSGGKDEKWYRENGKHIISPIKIHILIYK